MRSQIDSARSTKEAHLAAALATGAGARVWERFDAVVATALLFLTTAAVNLQMPLYRRYAAAAGYGNAVTTIVFAAYVAGLVPTLLLFGGLSDRVGRKPVMIGGLLSAVLATSLMIVHPGIHWLSIARVLQGIGVGLSMGAGSAYLSECLDHERGTNRAPAYVTFATSLGFGGGALFTGTVLLFGPSDRPMSYWVIATAGVLCLAVTMKIRQHPPLGGSLMRLPHFAKDALPADVAIGTAWAVTGVVISLIPAQLARYNLAAWAGHAVFLVNGTGALLQGYARRMPASVSLRTGFALLPTGYALVLFGAWRGLLPLVLVGAALAGAACYGFTYLGGLARVNETAGRNRARAVSAYFLSAYIGFGLPSVALGFLADRIGLLPTLGVFGAVIVLACGTLAMWTRPRRTEESYEGVA